MRKLPRLLSIATFVLAGLSVCVLGQGAPVGTAVAQVRPADGEPRASQPADQDKSEATANVKIIVGERVLIGPASAPEHHGASLFLPVVSIARALGDEASVNPATHTVSVRRQNGVAADFSAQTHQVRENGAVILLVSAAAEIVFPLDGEQLMVPLEVTAALLDVSIIVEDSGQTVRIHRGTPPDQTVRQGAASSCGPGSSSRSSRGSWRAAQASSSTAMAGRSARWAGYPE